MTADAEKVELRQRSYDKILSVNNYTIWNNPRAGLENITKSLKPGGQSPLPCSQEKRMQAQKRQECSAGRYTMTCLHADMKT